jgi:hypothetical protein
LYDAAVKSLGGNFTTPRLDNRRVKIVRYQRAKVSAAFFNSNDASRIKNVEFLT